MVRALLALFVIMIHVLPINTEFKICVRPLLNTAVAGFIFLSGFLTKKNIDAKHLCHRIAVVAIVYILFTVAYTAARYYPLGIIDTMQMIAENIVSTRGTYTLYYLIVYIQLSILTPLLLRIVEQKKAMLDAIVIAIQPLYIACFYLCMLKGIVTEEAPWCVMFFPAWIAYYYIGLLARDKETGDKKSSCWFLAVLAIFGLALQVAEGFYWYSIGAARDMYFSQMRFTALLENIPLLLLMAHYIRSPREKCNKLLCKIGDASFGIYLLHPAFIMVCDKLIVRNEATFLITFAFAAAGSFATVLLLNKLLPRKALKYTGLGLK